jgi:small subunit ribosomal protein S2
MRTNGQYDLFSKKEIARYERERKKLEKNLSGIKEMAGLPDALFVIDTRLESIAIKEAVKLGIPVIGVADTNCDPDEIDFIIPGNDDALRAIRLITDTIAQAYLDGKAVFESRQKEIAEQAEKQRQFQAQQAAAAKEADGKEQTEAQAPSPESGDAARPKTTVRKAFQRKAKPRRSEPAAATESTSPAEEAASLPEPEGERPEEQKLPGS